MICVEAMKNAIDKNNILEVFRKVLHMFQYDIFIGINEEDTNYLDWNERHRFLSRPFIIDPTNPYNNLLRGQNVAFFLTNLQHMAHETSGKIGISFDHKSWKILMKVLYIKDSAARCGLSNVASLYISEIEKVHMPQVIKASTSVEAVSDKLMRFICCVAAFIPKKEHSNQVDVYGSHLLDALLYFKTNGLNMYQGRGYNVNFEMVYPLETKGICIGAVVG